MPDNEAAITAITQVLCDSAKTMALEAQNRGFLYFACQLDLSRPSMPIRMQFADGNGVFFERSSGIKQVAATRGIRLDMNDSVGLKIAVQSRVLNMPGIASIRSGMTQRRISAGR